MKKYCFALLLFFCWAFLMGQRTTITDNMVINTGMKLGGSSAITRIVTDGTLAGVTNADLATAAAVKTYVDGLTGGLSSTYFPLSGGTLTGTGGAGFIGFPAQGSTPTAPGAGFRVFANSAGNMGVIRADGYVTTFDFSTATGNRFFTYPANAGTFGILENAQTWTAANTFTGDANKVNGIFTVDRATVSGVDIIENTSGKRWRLGISNNNGTDKTFTLARLFGGNAEPLQIYENGSFVIQDAAGTYNQVIASAVLNVSSLTKGLMIPKPTTAQRDAISSPADLLMVMNATTKRLNYYNTTLGAWVEVPSVPNGGLTNTWVGVGDANGNINGSSGLIYNSAPIGTNPTSFIVSPTISANANNQVLAAATFTGTFNLSSFTGVKQHVANFLSDNTDGAIIALGRPGLTYYATIESDFLLRNLILDSGPSGNNIQLKKAGVTVLDVGSPSLNYTGTFSSVATSTVYGLPANFYGVSNNTGQYLVFREGAIGGEKAAFGHDGSGNADIYAQNGNVDLTSVDLKMKIYGATGFVRIGGNSTPTSFLHLNPTYSSTGDLSGGGYAFRLATATYNNTTTLASGTVATASLASFDGGTVAATNAMTYTKLSTVRIASAPVAGTNVSISNPYAFEVVSGNTFFGGQTNTFSSSNTDLVVLRTTNNVYARMLLYNNNNVAATIENIGTVGASFRLPGTLSLVGSGGIVLRGAASFSANVDIQTNGTNSNTPDFRFTTTQNLLIGTATDVPSSILTLNSTSKGFLLPRGTDANIAAVASPALLLMMGSTTSERINVKRTDGFYQIAYVQDIKRDTAYKTVNANLDLSGLTTTIANRYKRVVVETIVTASATGNNTITLPVPSAALLNTKFEISVEDTSGDGDISVLNFGTDGTDGYLYNGDGTYQVTQNLFPGIGVYVSVSWCEAKSAYRWKLQ